MNETANMPETPGQPISASRKVVAWAVLLVLLTLIIYLLLKLGAMDLVLPNDFVQYWAAGRLNLSGGNPYDGEELLVLEKLAGRQETTPISFYNPPGTLALVMTIAWLPYAASRLVCIFLQLLILWACSFWIWRQLEGPRSYNWLALMVSFTFFPNLMAVIIGQITPLLLVAVLGFLQLQRLGKEFWAGLAASLLTIKPHLLYLFWIALLLWSCHGRHWKTLAGVAVGTLLMVGIALIPNPRLLEQYFTLMGNFWPQDYYLVPTLGSWLRLALGWEHRWIQNAPALLGSLWLVGYFYWRQPAGWNWDREMPLLILVSCVTTIYGGWIFDLVVMILPVLQLFAWTIRENKPYRLGWLIVGHLLFNLAWLKLRVSMGDPCIGWLTPFLLIVYVWLGLRYRRWQQRELA